MSGDLDNGTKFDRAELKDPNGATIKTLSWDEFWSLPLVERVTRISDGSIKFFRRGQPVGAREAVKR